PILDRPLSNLLSPETFEFFARYLLAGYVVIFVRAAFFAGLRPKPAELLMEAVIFSLLTQALIQVCAPLVAWAFLQAFESEAFAAWLSTEVQLFLEVLLVPAGIGVLLGYFVRSRFRNRLLNRLSMPIVHPSRRAHDYAFGFGREPCFVELTFEDGVRLGGWFGVDSVAASDEERADLYLERVYRIGEAGDWEEASPPRSALIKLENVRTVEFLDLEKSDGK
ncbi:MAG: DUF6338 family protein, partial [Pseudomonadota bacterium]